MRKALKTVHLFSDRETSQLRRALAKQARVLPENILFGHGSTHVLGCLLSRLRPQKVLAPSPLPSSLLVLLRRYGSELVPFPLFGDEGFVLDTTKLLSCLRGVDLLFMPNPHPMTGAIVGPESLKKIMDSLEGTRTTLVLDEALMEYAGISSPVERAVTSDTTIILRSFSLFYGLAGLCLGYSLGSKAMLDRITSNADAGPVATMAAAAALASLRDKGFASRTAQFLKEEKTYLSRKLSRLKTCSVIDTASNFLLVSVEGPAAALKEKLLQWRILLEAFEDGKGATFLRLPLRTHRENARLAKALERLLKQEETP